MKIPPPPSFAEIHPPEIRIAMKSAWQQGYLAGRLDGNPGRKRTAAKAKASRENGLKGGRPKKPIEVN